MSRIRDDTHWVRRGRQKAAVARALVRPVTATEILKAARTLAPRLQLRDVWFILKQFRERGLVSCFNPGEVTGKVHGLTSKGKRVLRTAFPDISFHDEQTLDWRLHGWLMRGKLRRLILETLTQAAASLTATEIRKRINPKHGLSLNTVLRVLVELELQKLLRSGMQGRRKTYALARSGPLFTAA